MKKLTLAASIFVLGTLAVSAQETAAAAGEIIETPPSGNAEALSAAPSVSPSNTSPAGGYAKNCLYLEALGQGMLYSINYEYMFTPHVSGRIGYTGWSLPLFLLVSAGTLDYQGGPVMVNYLWGDGDHHFETGIGALLGAMRYSGVSTIFDQTISSKYTFVPMATATLGYRFQPKDGGFLFKFGLTPIWNGSSFMFSGGISLGGVF